VEFDSDGKYTYYFTDRTTSRVDYWLDETNILSFPWVRFRSTLYINESALPGDAVSALGQITNEPTNIGVSGKCTCENGGYIITQTFKVEIFQKVGTASDGGSCRCFVSNKIKPTPVVTCNKQNPIGVVGDLNVVVDTRLAGQSCDTVFKSDICWVENRHRQTVASAMRATIVGSIGEPGFMSRTKRFAAFGRVISMIFRGVLRAGRSKARNVVRSVVRAGVKRIPKSILKDALNADQKVSYDQPTSNSMTGPGSSYMLGTSFGSKSMRESVNNFNVLNANRSAFAAGRSSIDGPISQSETPIAILQGQELFREETLDMEEDPTSCTTYYCPTGRKRRSLEEDYTWGTDDLRGVIQEVRWLEFQGQVQNELWAPKKYYKTSYRPTVGELLKLNVDKEMANGNTKFETPDYTVIFEIGPESISCNDESTYFSIGSTIVTFDWKLRVMSMAPINKCGVIGGCERVVDCNGETSTKYITYPMTTSQAEAMEKCKSGTCSLAMLEAMADTIIIDAVTTSSDEDRIAAMENNDREEDKTDNLSIVGLALTGGAIAAQVFSAIKGY